MLIDFIMPSGDSVTLSLHQVPARGDFVLIEGTQYRVAQVQWAPPLEVEVFLEDPNG